MTITLTAEIEELLDEQIKSGTYGSAEEIILLSLRLFKEQQAKHTELRHLMETARAEIEQGNYVVCRSDEEMEAFTDDLIRQVEVSRTQASSQ